MSRKNYEKKNLGSKGLKKMKIYKFVKSFTSQRAIYDTFSQNFYFNLRRDNNNKKILWASRLWVGRRKEPILAYVPKNYEKKKNSGCKGLICTWNFRATFRSFNISLSHLKQKLVEKLSKKHINNLNYKHFPPNYITSWLVQYIINVHLKFQGNIFQLLNELSHSKQKCMNFL